MPPVTADDSSSPVIAYLIIVPIAIVLVGTVVAICCSEKWNKNDNRLKRFLRRRKGNKKRFLVSTIKTEDTTTSEGVCCGPTSAQGSDYTIAVTDPQSTSEPNRSRPV
jgi:hypothetical protein